MTIWKFPLQIDDMQRIKMPVSAQILTIAMQHDGPKVWAIVDPNAALVNHIIFCRGTGHSMREAENCPYIATTQHSDGYLIFHWFDGGEQS